jgi:hypothetical protein
MNEENNINLEEDPILLTIRCPLSLINMIDHILLDIYKNKNLHSLNRSVFIRAVLEKICTSNIDFKSCSNEDEIKKKINLYPEVGHTTDDKVQSVHEFCKWLYDYTHKICDDFIKDEKEEQDLNMIRCKKSEAKFKEYINNADWIENTRKKNKKVPQVNQHLSNVGQTG